MKNSAQESQQAQILALTEENEMLFEHLNTVQLELESCYGELNKLLSQNAPTMDGVSKEIKEIITAYIDFNERENILKDVASAIHKEFNALNAELAKRDSIRYQLSKFGSRSRARISDKALREYEKIFTQKGVEDLKSQLKNFDNSQKADIYTALAKEMRQKNPASVAQLARLAWLADPKPYRLKWLIFRLYDAGEFIAADALRPFLPKDLQLSASEEKKMQRLQKDALVHCKIKTEKLLDKLQLSSPIQQPIRSIRENTAPNFISGNHAPEDGKISQLEKEIAALKENLNARELQANQNRQIIDQLRASLNLLAIMRQNSEMELRSKTMELLHLSMHAAGLENFINIQLRELRENNSSVKDLLVRVSEELPATLINGMKEIAALKENLNARELQANQNRQIMEELCSANNMKLKELGENNNSIKDLLLRVSQELPATLMKELDEARAQSVEKEWLEEKFSHAEQTRHAFGTEVINSLNHKIKLATHRNMAFASLEQYFAEGIIPELEPWRAIWPVAPDFLLWLIKLINANQYDLIIEFGSGISTLYVCKTLKLLQNKQSDIPRFLSFDHNEQYYKRTKEMLAEAGINNNLVDLQHAPLANWQAGDHTEYLYYSCADKLDEYSHAFKNRDSKILVIVDGPPGDTCENSRYPAFPHIMKRFSPAAIDFVLDDYGRKEEKNLAAKWLQICEEGGIEHQIIEKDLEKGAMLLRVNENNA